MQAHEALDPGIPFIIQPHHISPGQQNDQQTTEPMFRFQQQQRFAWKDDDVEPRSDFTDRVFDQVHLPLPQTFTPNNLCDPHETIQGNGNNCVQLGVTVAICTASSRVYELSLLGSLAPLCELREKVQTQKPISITNEDGSSTTVDWTFPYGLIHVGSPRNYIVGMYVKLTYDWLLKNRGIDVYNFKSYPSDVLECFFPFLKRHSMNLDYDHYTVREAHVTLSQHWHKMLMALVVRAQHCYLVRSDLSGGFTLWDPCGTSPTFWGTNNLEYIELYLVFDP
eukprot:PhF_6_TR40595/c1_g1_i1/m.60889